MISSMMRPAPFYVAPSVDVDIPWLDVGTPDEIFDRAGLSGKGKNQKVFLSIAKGAGLVCVRLGMSFLAVSKVDLVHLISKL